MHDNSKAQKRDIPNSAPALAIVVILPVPMLYPSRNKPGPMRLNAISILFLVLGCALISGSIVKMIRYQEKELFLRAGVKPKQERMG
jgi:hypothetical protein